MMKYYRDPDSGGVYAFAADGSDNSFISADLVPMSPAEVEKHLNPPRAPLTREQIEALRLFAYAEPLTGSDRHFAEAQREGMLGNAETAEAAKSRGLARFVEIQAEYPWPEE